MIELVRADIVLANKFATVRNDEVRFGNGSHGRHLRISPAQENGEGVCNLPVYDGKIAMVETFRYPIGSWQWALPRGFGHGSGSLASAKAELDEELGITDAEFEEIGRVNPDSGLLASTVPVFLVRPKRPELRPKDKVEVREAQWFSGGEVTAMVGSGALSDSFTLSALMIATTRGAISLAD